MKVDAQRRATAVTIERLDGIAVTLDPHEPVWASPTGREDDRVLLRSVATVQQVLTNPRAWIEYETWAEWRDGENEPIEAWQEPDAEADRPAVARVYARAVVGVMVVYGDA